MALNDDSAVLVCVRVADMRGKPPRGSFQFLCEKCHRTVWVSPASVAEVSDARPCGNFAYVCAACVSKMKIPKGTKFMLPGPRVCAELRASGCTDDEIRSLFKMFIP